MTVYERDGHTEHQMAKWPYSRALPPSVPMGASIAFDREGDCLVLTPTGGKVSLDVQTMRALGDMLFRKADEIAIEIAQRNSTPQQ